MSETPTDVCNRALSDIGARANISSLSDTSPQGVACGLWYHKERKRLLRMAPWGFARRQKALTLISQLTSNNTSQFPFLYKYEYPSDCLKLRYVIEFPPSSDVPLEALNFAPLTPCRTNRFLVQNEVDNLGASRKFIITNVPNAIGVYTGDENTVSMFDDLFETALTSALSYRFIMPLTGKYELKPTYKQEVNDALMQARAVDGNEAMPTTDHTPDWIRARGMGYEWAYANGPVWGSWYDAWDGGKWGE